ncbi:MAG: glycine cleavage system protein H [Candidatus Marinimicrobia bacterium]|nr:glycine cleavage system protein H [Candidatus Neomarinimicrobiota bacterium]
MNSKYQRGMKVIPTGERKCLWMEAGVVSYKLCTNQYQCSICDYDRAMSNRVMKERKIAEESVDIITPKKEINVWVEEFRHLPADQRKCRYMLMGEVPYKICPNSFRCGECSFDQMMQDRKQPAFDYSVKNYEKVAGVYMYDELQYFRNHTWLQLERNGKYRIGIDDFARRIIGKIDGIELSAVGKNLDFEEYCLTIHHEYGDLELFSPVKGIVDSINQEMLDNVNLIIDEPYQGGWLMTIDPISVTKSNKNLLKGDEAKAWMIEETNLLSKTLYGELGVTLADGATISAEISKNISSEKWKELVRKHLFVR